MLTTAKEAASETNESNKSVLFSKQLEIIASKSDDNLSQRSATSAVIDIRNLGLKVDKARKKPRIEANTSGHSLLFNRDKKVTTVTNKGDSNIFKDFDKIRESSKKLKDYKNSKLSENIKRPDDIELDSNNSLVSQLQNTVDKFRDETTHAIIKESGVDLVHSKDRIGIIKKIQILNNSLRFIEVETPDLKLFKVGLVALFNEWIELKIGDQILLQDIDQNNVDLQWCLKWKKVVKS